MKNAIILFLSLLLFSNTSWGQQYHMLGRFVNTAPDSTSLDSVAFEFTATTYAYYVNASTVPSSSGTYAVVTSTMAPDSLFLFEDSLGVCNTNNGGYTVKFGLQYQLSPYYGLTIIESISSIDSCPSHSYKIQGDYIGYEGEIVFTNSVKNASNPSALHTNVYNAQLQISSQYNEKISVQVMNLNGQKMMAAEQAILVNGQRDSFDFRGLSPGIYFVIIQSEHERKAIKFVL